MDRSTANTQAALLHAEALALARAGRLLEAEQQWRQALARDKSNFDVLHNLGAIALQTGRAEEALTHFTAAEALKPEAPEVHRNRAIAFLRLGHPALALAALQRLLVLKPDDEMALHQLVRILMDDERGEEAVTALRAALAHEPSPAYVPLMLANVLRVLGRLDEARAVLAPALKRGQDYYLFADLVRFVPGDPQIAAMEALLHKAMAPEDLAALKFALAKAYSDSGAPDKSFALLGEANRLMRRLVRYDEATTLADFARVAEAFTREQMVAAASPETFAPIIILGMPRSGTSLVEQILASHPAIVGAGENAVLPPLLERHVPGFPEVIAPAEALAALARDYRAGMGRLLSTKPRLADKTLQSVFFVGLLHQAMPNARFVWVRRDPLDTCLSCYGRRFLSGQEYSYDLGELGRYYRGYERLMRHWQEVLPPEALLTVRYEDVVADLETQTRRLLDHCGEEFDPACLAFHTSKRPVFTASAAQVRQPLYNTSVRRWRPPPEALRPLLQALGQG
ncbi:MAG: sulfotransferase [Rhizomicrobium sp.]|nr:sulfotransferase [Rhizomicrobium sp.]